MRGKHGQKEFEQQLPSEDRTAFPSRPEADRDITQRRGENQIRQQEQRQQMPDANYFAQRHPSEGSQSTCADESQARAKAAAQSNEVHEYCPTQDGYDRQPQQEKKRAAIEGSDHCEKEKKKKAKEGKAKEGK